MAASKNDKSVVVNNANMNMEEKRKALDAAITKIERDYGKGSVMKLGDKNALDVDTISTGSISLDKALGVGGIYCIGIAVVDIWKFLHRKLCISCCPCD